MHKAGEIIERTGKYKVLHYQKHIQDKEKRFESAVDARLHLPLRFRSCDYCSEGYPLYKLVAIEH
jgi:hypothetical protein